MKSQLRKHRWFSRTVFALSLGLLFLPTGCANPSTPATPSASSPSAPSAPSSVTVAINPLTATVPEGGSLSFVATLKGAANGGVTWSVQEGTTGGSITSSGVYTAPNTLGTYHVVVRSVADATASASAAVTIQQPLTTSSSVSVAISPLTVTVAQGGSLSFVATVKGAANTSVTWSVQEGATGGSITSSGVYTAPYTLGTYHVVATSVADTTASASAVVTSSGPNRVPTIAALSPTSVVAGSATGFALTVTGDNFVTTSVINFGATTLTTAFASSYWLTAAIPSTAVTSAGNVAVTVTNPGPGGGTSNVVQFVINGGTNPIPAISSLSVSCAPVGAQDFRLAVWGTDLAPNSIIRWNGTDLPTTFYGAIPATSNLATDFAIVPASYIATAGTATVTVFNPAPVGGVSNPVSLNITAAGVGPISMAVDPTGKFAYVANAGCGDPFDSNVSMYTINPADGTLTSAGPPVTTGDHYVQSAQSVAVDPSGRFAYVANFGDYEDRAGSLSMYAINATTGTLTPKGLAPAFHPESLTVHPSGKFVYVPNEAGEYSSVSTYAIDATTGVLQLVGSVSNLDYPVSVTVDPSGKFAYVGINNPSDPNGANLLIYSINGATGALTSIGTIKGNWSPDLIAMHPSGKFVYLVDAVLDQISTYTLNPTTGNLASIGTLSAIPGPIVIHPSGKFAYVTSSAGGVAMYTIDATTGALTFAGTTASGSTPGSITIHPSGRFAYGTNSVSNSVSMYSVDTSSGSLMFIGTIGT